MPLVVDPVMIATSGRRLLKPGAVKILCEQLLPLAALVTPNLAEAAALTGRPLRTASRRMRRAAREIQGCFGCAALVKGGHLPGAREAADIFFDGDTELLLTAPFVRGVRTHGTGCTGFSGDYGVPRIGVGPAGGGCRSQTAYFGGDCWISEGGRASSVESFLFISYCG